MLFFHFKRSSYSYIHFLPSNYNYKVNWSGVYAYALSCRVYLHEVHGRKRAWELETLSSRASDLFPQHGTKTMNIFTFSMLVQYRALTTDYMHTYTLSKQYIEWKRKPVVVACIHTTAIVYVTYMYMYSLLNNSVQIYMRESEKRLCGIIPPLESLRINGWNKIVIIHAPTLEVDRCMDRSLYPRGVYRNGHVRPYLPPN